MRLALGETQIIQETKKYLEAEGVRLEAFDRPPQKRSKSVIIAKNLPAHTPASEIRDLFFRFGVLGRVLLPPVGITAVIEFAEPGIVLLYFELKILKILNSLFDRNFKS